MMRWIAAALLTFLMLSACAEGADDAAVTTTLPAVDAGSSTTSTSPVETTTTTQATTTTTRATTTTTIEGTLIRVVVEAGEVTVRGSTSVPIDERVTIRVRADVEDEVHVHTYDLLTEVAPGSAAEISFVADVPGVHEVELEQAGIKLLDLEVGG